VKTGTDIIKRKESLAMDRQILDALEAIQLRMTHGINLLFILWIAFDNLNRGIVVDNDRIASAIYIVWGQFDSIADEISNFMDKL